MLIKIFLFEWLYFTKQPSFYITSLIFFGLAFLSPNSGMSFLGNVFKNGSYIIAFISIFLSMFSVFLVVNFVVNTALRNQTSDMQEILYCKPFNVVSYQLGRFLGSFSIVLIVFSLVPIGYLIGSIMPWVDETRIGPTQLSYYLVSFFYISVPTLFMLSCIFYTLAFRFKSMKVVYLAVIILFILNEMSQKLLSIPELQFISILLDPFAMNTFQEITQYWTSEQKNSQLLSFSGLLMINRLTWVAIGFFILSMFAGFSYKLLLDYKVSNKKNKQLVESDRSIQAKHPKINVQQANIESAINLSFYHFITRAKFEIKQVVFDPAFYILCILSTILLLTMLLMPEGAFGNSYWPVTQKMVGFIQSGLGVLSLIIITYYSGEVIWRERESDMMDIIDSMPVTNISFWLSKLVAVWTVLILLLTLSMLFTILFQLNYGYTRLEIGQYLISLFYVSALPWMMMTTLAFLFQVISPNKYVGMFLFILFVFSRFAMNSLGLEHNLAHFGQSPAVNYSDINGYGTSLIGHSWYMLYWGALSLVISIVCYGLWQRGQIQTIRIRLKSFAYQVGSRGRLVLISCGFIFLSTGATIYYNSFWLNQYQNSEQLIQLHADYEKHYAQYLDAPIPTLTKLNAAVDIFPQQRKVNITASIVIENKSVKAISKFLISMPGYNPLFSAILGYNPLDFSVKIDGGSMGPTDGELNTHWFKFDKPLQPGESRNGQYNITIQQQGFSEKNANILIEENSAFFQNNESFPIFGYMPSQQIVSQRQRKRHDLPPTERQHKLEDSQYYQQSSGETVLGSNTGYLDFETTVSTTVGQIAIAPGYLINQWTENNRHYFHYKMDAPIQNYFAYFSGKYQTLISVVNDVEFSVYFHPEHAANTKRIMQAMQDSVSYYSEAFGPYQHKQARVVEFAGPKNFGQDFPNVIAYSERAGFIHDLTDPNGNDQVYWFIAHEMAHQWWGGQVDAANVQGGTMLVETLAQYSAYSLYRNKYGDGALRRMLKFEMERYFSGRSRELIEELPLMRDENQGYLHYDKGAIVMMSLSDVLGEEKLNIALKSFLSEFKFTQDNYPTTLDLLRHINKNTDASEKSFIQGAFAEINIYDLKLTEVVIEQNDDKQFDVTLTINAHKTRSKGKGNEIEIPLSETIDIGLFTGNPDFLKDKSEALYLKKHLIVSGKNIIKISLPFKPLFAGIDPFVQIIDQNSLDNTIRL